MFQMGCKKDGQERKAKCPNAAVADNLLEHFNDSEISMDSMVQNDECLQNVK